MGYIEELRKIVGHRPLIFVGSVVIITDKLGRILLQQRKFPHGVWGIPGGLMELGESTEEVARREVKEETGLTIGNLHLINVYSGKEHFIVAENGDEFYVVTAAYYTDEFEGDIQVDESESLRFEFFHPHRLPERLVGSHMEVINDYINKKGESF
ncbi:NUDIX hydrolase [Ornithinibacillus californiensis]|uniref:NUDIX hydrolase n=1 Tax=Ornithinibacillus californiensis TaxID=161536 RepID=UPI00064E065F|nr:NUDIX hydrolase [Ornithinibacillus californiensis]